MKIKLSSDKLPSSLAELEDILLEAENVKHRKTFFDSPAPVDISLKDVKISAKSVNTAIKRLLQARQSEEQIVVYGDYDADGISATAVVWQILNRLKFKVMPFIPDRHKHGYGLSQQALEEVIELHHPSLILTVDNGIVAHEQIAWLKKQQIDVILTDHHQMELDKNGKTRVPAANSVVHTTFLCGTTVAWILMRELIVFLKEDLGIIIKQLDLCGIATIADQVPLQGANRSFAKSGLEALRQTQRPGLIKLYDQAGIKPNQIDERTVGYAISPRINAMGRMAHGLDALRLLCTGNLEQAGELAKLLESVNQDRRDLTLDLMDIAIKIAEKQSREHIIVIHHLDFHDGVIGLIAGRIVEKFAKPAVVIGSAKMDGDGSGVAKASARSIAGVHITQLLRLIKSDLISLGGHPLAAGFSLRADKIALVTTKLQKLALVKIKTQLLESSLQVACQLPHFLLSVETAELIERFRPFGQGNFQPIFLISDLNLIHVKQIGQDGQHLKLMVQISPLTGLANQPIQLIMWRNGFQAERLRVKKQISVVCALELNSWHGKTSLQLMAHQLELE